MDLVNEFTVPAPVEVAWAVLSDIERVAPCLPGAVLESRDGDTYVGRVALKLGPVGLSFSGTAEVVARDDAQHRLVIRGAAKDAGGQGGAQALITMTVAAASPSGVGSDGQSAVRVTTGLALSGKVAQFGSGPINHVNRRIIGQFVNRLSLLVVEETGSPSAPATEAREAVASPFSGLSKRGRDVAGTIVTALAGVLVGIAISRAVQAAASRRVGCPTRLKA